MAKEQRNGYIILALLVVLLTTLGKLGPVNAGTDPVLGFDQAISAATTCATHQITVNVSDVAELTAYHLEVSFDPSIVSVTEVVNGGFLDGAPELAFYEPTNEIDNINGLITFGMSQQGTGGDPDPKTGSGILIKITMQALVANGTTDFVIDSLESLLVDWPETNLIPFTVESVGEVNTRSCAPTDINLSNNVLPENQPIGTEIGMLISLDPDILDTVFVYSFVDDANYPNNQFFGFSGDKLTTSSILDYETQSSFTIKIRTTDPWGEYYEEVFNITITDLNDAPVANDDYHETYRDMILTIAAPGVLINDFDQDIADNPYASLNTSPQHGTVQLFGDGSFTYIPHNGFVGDDFFTYTMISYPTRDPHIDTATVYITVHPIYDYYLPLIKN